MKKGFSMTELIIVLTLLGVVASFTIPNVVPNFQNPAYTASFRSTYNELSKAYELIINNHKGNPENSWTDTDTMLTTFGTYYNFTKTCKTTDTDTCFYDNSKTKNLKGNTNSVIDSSAMSKGVLIDGSVIMFYHLPGGNCIGDTIVIDTNGEKNPNQLGRDIFTFIVRPDGLKPAGFDLDLATQNSNCDPNGAVSDANSGSTCGARIMREGQINY